MSQLGQSLPVRSAPVSYQVRNSLKADEGWHGKSGILLAHHRVKPVGPNAVSPANTDRVKTVARSRSFLGANVGPAMRENCRDGVCML